MNVDLYERIWMWAAGLIIGIFIAVIGASSVVMLFTLIAPREVAGPIEFSEPLLEPGTRTDFLDRLGAITAVAVVLIVVAYAYPIWQHLQMPRFGSPGFSPF